MELSKLQNEYEQKLDDQEKSIQDIQERAEGLSTERTIVKPCFHFLLAFWLAETIKKLFNRLNEHQIENTSKNNILEIKEEILDKENEISRFKRKLNRKKNDIQEVSFDHSIRFSEGNRF